MTRPLSRIQPALEVHQMKTYAIRTPLETHTRPATCPQVGCLNYERGWTTKVAAGSAEERALLRACSGAEDRYQRAFKRVHGNPGFMIYIFEPGTACFLITTHRVPLERPALYVVEHGDWRAKLGRRTVGSEEWINDFGEHQDRIARAVNGSPQ